MKILLATDGSGPARAAIDFLIGFPLPGNAEITLTTVIRAVLPDEEVQGLPDEQRLSFEAARTAASEEAAGLLEAEARRLRSRGLNTGTRILFGRPAEEIVRLATAMNSDIVVLGSHGLSGTKRFLLGSVSDRVFEYAPCCVLIVKPDGEAAGDQTPFRGSDDQWRILLAFDDSPPARKAVTLCSTLPLEGKASLSVLTVMPMIRMYRQDIRQRLSWVWQAKKQAAQMALDWAAAELRHKDADLSTALVEHPDVAQALLDAASQSGSDLIVIGHKGRTALERFMLGSVTARVAHHAPCSVLSVRDCR